MTAHRSILSRALSVPSALALALFTVACGGGDGSSSASGGDSAAAADGASSSAAAPSISASASPVTYDGSAVIIVSGASGNLGGEAVDDLLEVGVPAENLILVSRTPEELSRYAELGAVTRYGDFTEPESLDAAYAGGDRMLLISINTLQDRPRLHGNAVDAAVRAGVEHIVYTSFVDAPNNPSPIADDHRATEAHIRESGLTYTFLRNQLYMDGLVQRAAGMVEEGRVVVRPDDPGTAYVARSDCARAAAAVLADPEGHENRAYDLTGPDVIRTVDIAEAAREITGTEIEVVVAEGADAEGLPAPFASGTVMSDAFLEITGEEPISLRELLEMNRDVVVGS